MKLWKHFSQLFLTTFFVLNNIKNIIIREYQYIKLYRYQNLSNYFPLPIKLESKGKHIQKILTLKELSLALFWFPLVKKNNRKFI